MESVKTMKPVKAVAGKGVHPVKDVTAEQVRTVKCKMIFLWFNMTIAIGVLLQCNSFPPYVRATQSGFTELEEPGDSTHRLCELV